MLPELASSWLRSNEDIWNKFHYFFSRRSTSRSSTRSRSPKKSKTNSSTSRHRDNLEIYSSRSRSRTPSRKRKHDKKRYSANVIKRTVLMNERWMKFISNYIFSRTNTRRSTSRTSIRSRSPKSKRNRSTSRHRDNREISSSPSRSPTLSRKRKHDSKRYFS